MITWSQLLRKPELSSNPAWNVASPQDDLTSVLGEGVFIRAVQIGISNAPGAVAATSPALASRWEDELSRHTSVKSALLARKSCATFPCKFSRQKHAEFIKRYPVLVLLVVVLPFNQVWSLGPAFSAILLDRRLHKLPIHFSIGQPVCQ